MTRTRDLLAVCALGLSLAGAGCQAILDIDSLKTTDAAGDGAETDGQAYDAAGDVALRGLAPRVIALAHDRGSVEFSWLPRAGRPSAVDLTLGASSPWMQVFSRGGRPFARIGLKVLPLQAGKRYQLFYRRAAHHVQLELRNRHGRSLFDGAREEATDASPAVLLSPTFVGRRVVVRSAIVTAAL